MTKKIERTNRGFIKFGEHKSKWHGDMRVQESSAAFEGPCFWIFSELSYSNEPTKNRPDLHLNLKDAEWLHAALGRCIKAAKAGKTCERP